MLKMRLKDPTESGPAVLAWAVEGCMRWQKTGLGVPEAVERATEQYRAEMDPLQEFLDERCVISQGAWVAAATLRAAYEAWAKTNGERYVLDSRSLAERLRSRGCVQEVRKVAGVSARVWVGVGLLAEGGEQ